MTAQILPSDGVAEGRLARRPSDWLRTLGLRLAIWLDACANHWAAAAMYQQLSRLSDAELARRGLSRATLARMWRQPHRIATSGPPRFNGVALGEAVSR